jgi:hypothetical protein
MKQMLIIFCMILGLNACKDRFEPIGKQDDTIKLSTTALTVKADGGTFTVTSEGKSWDIDFSICMDNVWYDLGGDRFDVVVEKSKSGYQYIVRIGGPWFSVTKETTQKITFSIQPNDTGKVRTLGLSIWAGNYSTGIVLTQTAD